MNINKWVVLKLKSSATKNVKTKEAVKQWLKTVSWTSSETRTEVFYYWIVRRHKSRGLNQQVSGGSCLNYNEHVLTEQGVPHQSFDIV